MEREYYQGSQEFPEESVDEGQEIPESIENEDSQEEPILDDAEEIPQTEIPRKKSHIGARLSQAQKEKYRALEEARLLREENDRLRQLADVSTKTALEHYDKSVIQKIQNAKDQKIKALETGDINAQADADIALSLATAEYQNLANLRAQNNIGQSPQGQEYEGQPQYYQQQDMIQNHNMNYAKQWIAQNDWCIPTSDNYDEEMSEKLEEYCNAFDYKLREKNLQYYIRSPEYFQVVEGYLNQLKNEGRRPKGELRMKQPENYASPVRGSYNMSSQPHSSYVNNSVKLTQEEKQMAKLFGISDKEYLRRKIDDIKNENMKEGWRR